MKIQTTRKYRPIRIGIFSAPMPHKHINKAQSYLHRDYIAWIEMSGAIPVIIPYNTPDLTKYLNSINGVVWVGGDIENKKMHTPTQYKTLLSAYEHTFKHATNETLRGNYYPIWGTCLGFDFLAMMGNHSGLPHMQQIHKTTPGKLTFRNYSRIQRVFPATMLRQMAIETVTQQNHTFGFDPDSAQTNQMRRYLRIISIDTSDISSQRFVNMFEYKHFPFYGTQWHPERPVSELSKEVAMRLSLFLKRECSKNQIKTIWNPPGVAISSLYTVLLT